jgi:hypothetical protein
MTLPPGDQKPLLADKLFQVFASLQQEQGSE